MWRPKEGWINPYKDADLIDEARLTFKLKDGTLLLGRDKIMREIAYEAGADAMLEALRKQGHRVFLEDIKVSIPIIEQGAGYLVFIPDKEEE